MCFYNHEPYAEVYCKTLPKARKEHRCHECFEVIPRGERYQKVTGIAGGGDGPFTYKCCRRCVFDIDRIVKHELASGCMWSESHPPIGGLLEALEEMDWQQTDRDAVPEEFSMME